MMKYRNMHDDIISVLDQKDALLNAGLDHSDLVVVMTKGFYNDLTGGLLNPNIIGPDPERNTWCKLPIRISKGVEDFQVMERTTYAHNH